MRGWFPSAIICLTTIVAGCRETKPVDGEAAPISESAISPTENPSKVAETESAVDADADRTALEALGVAFQNEESLGGLFVDLVAVKQMSDDDIKRLYNINDIAAIRLPGDFNDGQMTLLKNVTGLRHVNISANGITDAGLSHLHSIKSLERVVVFSSDVTEQGIAALKDALPDCKVEWTTTP